MSVVAPPSLRPAVLRLYRTLLKTARGWQAKDPLNTAEEAAYIRAETRRVFRSNSHLTRRDEVLRCIGEAEARLEIALHYGNPYPRPVHFPPKALARSQQKAWGRANLKRQASSRPLYLRSVDDSKPPDDT